MDAIKEKKIRVTVDSAIKEFSIKFENRYTKELNIPTGVINSKKNNVFMAELGNEFMFYSAFVRSFDSSFGKVLEKMANEIALISYEVYGKIESYLLPQQTQHIDYLMTEYDKHKKPSIDDYINFHSFQPRDTDNYLKNHETDNYLYNAAKNEHVIIELKAGGDLDNKKSKSEKGELLREYFLLKNKLINSDETSKEASIKIFLATAYNTYGEGNPWNQERVKQYFGEEELLIGKDYWNFICDDSSGFDVIYDQYKLSCHYIIDSLERIKSLYF